VDRLYVGEISTNYSKSRICARNIYFSDLSKNICCVIVDFASQVRKTFQISPRLCCGRPYANIESTLVWDTSHIKTAYILSVSSFSQAGSIPNRWRFNIYSAYKNINEIIICIGLGLHCQITLSEQTIYCTKQFVRSVTARLVRGFWLPPTISAQSQNSVLRGDRNLQMAHRQHRNKQLGR